MARARRAGRGTGLRTRLAEIDPGLVRLRLASIAVAAIALAVMAVAAARAAFAPAEPVTVLLFAGALAMMSNLAVNEPDLPRRRVTTALMVLPAAATTVAGAFLAPYRVPAAAAFVLVMVVAVWVRRYGPRGFALGMAGFMPFFFTQFLQVTPTQVPWLLVAVVAGIGATLLLRGVVFAERPARTLRRLVAAFRARAHAVVETTDDLLAALPAGGSGGGPDERTLESVRRARARLQEVALLVEDVLEQTTAGRVWPGLDDDVLALRVADAELALERLSVAARRLALPPADGPPEALDPGVVAALRTGLRHLRTALESGRGHPEILGATADARAAVAGLVADTRAGGERVQRTAFAVRRVADAIHHAQLDAPARRGEQVSGADGPEERRPSPPPAPLAAGEPAEDDVRPQDEPERPEPGGIALSTRQAVQVGVAATLAIVAGEIVAPSRWYWAVITAFVVFAGTNSRGDLLSRGWGRVVGTVAGVGAGMGLAALVGHDRVLSIVLLAVCIFLALYLVRVSPAVLAFGITAVLALVYGLIGQFSVEVLVLRVEETIIGALAAVVAAFLVLPRGTREAFGEAVGELVDAVDRVLREATDRLTGRPAPAPREGVRAMDDALATLRQRARPLAEPFARRRARSSHQRGLRVLVVCDVYARSLARVADQVSDPTWAATLDPAAAQVRANLDALRDVLVRGRRASDGGQVRAHSAERLVDAAEEHAARTAGDPHRRTTMLAAVRLLRRIDQAVVGLAIDLGAADDLDDADGQSPSTAASAGVANTRSGS